MKDALLALGARGMFLAHGLIAVWKCQSTYKPTVKNFFFDNLRNTLELQVSRFFSKILSQFLYIFQQEFTRENCSTGYVSVYSENQKQ